MNNPQTQKKDAYYFKHDVNSRNDIALSASREDAKEFSEKLDKGTLEQLSNLAMLGFFWSVLEVLREQSDFKIKLTPINIKYLAKDFGVNASIVNKYIEILTSDEYKLLKIEDDYLFSTRLINDMTDMNDVRSRFSKAGKASADARFGAKKGEKLTATEQMHAMAEKKAAAPRKLTLPPRFYDLWQDYCKNIGEDAEARKKELSYIEKHYADNHTTVINKLYASIVNQTEKNFYSDLTKKA